MDVQHPKDGAVYWEGPVNVSLEVTLTGEKAYRPSVCVRAWKMVDRLHSTSRLVLRIWEGARY